MPLKFTPNVKKSRNRKINSSTRHFLPSIKSKNLPLLALPTINTEESRKDMRNRNYDRNMKMMLGKGNTSINDMRGRMVRISSPPLFRSRVSSSLVILGYWIRFHSTFFIYFIFNRRKGIGVKM